MLLKDGDVILFGTDSTVSVEVRSACIIPQEANQMSACSVATSHSQHERMSLLAG